ncbi:bifunctional hydroxymethylpyrimidine kinase/phosphomethylpyrimidine kinase [Vineibacter terrae]|uniref:bifunctional hydroxymethylpyrimidine kinase/phosphomethylpyrimidine kinase n=1 Tax=Vineibacter terrae TaxID=2586908 RepID=UPI002E31DCA2|nr:bifunctional hydroxymethylpyrimidine kinase/phosphomethylpyrimidine kinase [Vineibacter terrae]HEX2890384.1 bifunctional hydroxymethylpyrimidine kinase/phosphomethylpyrimidine kinase [Vineibacter terrae]
MKGRVLIIAGSDSGGGAGIQADIKAVTALDGFAMTAITALTAQNTHGVHGVVGIEPAFIAQQIDVVLGDLGADAIKTGMLHSAAVIQTVASALAAHAPATPLVIDPVMVAKGGHRLLQAAAERSLIEQLLPRATLVTPNLPEAEALAGFAVANEADMARAGQAILAMGPTAVLVKGGHLEDSDAVIDLLVDAHGVMRFTHPRIATRSTHGTGCTLASAIACGLAQRLTLADAVTRARDYVRRAIETAPGFGGGHGPLNHAVTFNPDWRSS